MSEDEELAHIMSAPQGDSDLDGEAPFDAPRKNGCCWCGHDHKCLRTLWRKWWVSLQREIALRKRLKEAERALAELTKAHRQEVFR